MLQRCVLTIMTWSLRLFARVVRALYCSAVQDLNRQGREKRKKKDAGAAAAVNFYVPKTGATWIKLYVKYFSRHDVAHALGIVCMKSRLKRSLSLEASACDRSDRRIRPPLRTVLQCARADDLRCFLAYLCPPPLSSYISSSKFLCCLFFFFPFFFFLSGVAFHFVPACMPPHLSVFCVLIFGYPFPPKEKKNGL